MQCTCGYEVLFHPNHPEAIRENIVKGDKGAFFYSTFARLERRLKGSPYTETIQLYGCPSCGRVFIIPLP